MKANIHPIWQADCKVTCACGNTFTTGSTVTQIRVELCSACHPFYTGTQKFVDTLGQVDRFIKKTEVSRIKQIEHKKIIEARKSRVQNRSTDRPSLKDLLTQSRKPASS